MSNALPSNNGAKEPLAVNDYDKHCTYLLESTAQSLIKCSTCDCNYDDRQRTDIQEIFRVITSGKCYKCSIIKIGKIPEM